MEVLIIEDEPQAAERLRNLLKKVNPSLTVVAVLDSVSQASVWLSKHSSPQLIFMDIQLGDGLSFEIFDRVEVKSPIIFTTAYDEYALRAFKVNSVDYLLKPFDEAEVQKALSKFQHWVGEPGNTPAVLANIHRVIQDLSRKYKERFVVKVGEHLRTINVQDIRFFYSHDKVTFCQTSDKKRVILDFTLDQLQHMVNPDTFFRINRKYLVTTSAIADIIHYTNSRLRLVLVGFDDPDIIVARERVQEFKAWLDR